MIKQLENKEKYLNTLRTNLRGWTSTKRGSYQKCNETLTPLAFTATANNVKLRVIKTCGENNNCTLYKPKEVKERLLGKGASLR